MTPVERWNTGGVFQTYSAAGMMSIATPWRRRRTRRRSRGRAASGRRRRTRPTDGAQPAPCRRSSPGGVLAGAAASARHRRPPRPDRQPSAGGVGRGVLAGACASTPDPAGAVRVRGRSHSSAGLRPNRGRPWPQRKAASAAAHGVWSGEAALWAMARIAQHSRNRCFARPENLVVAAAIAGVSPFPTTPYQNAARMFRGSAPEAGDRSAPPA